MQIVEMDAAVPVWTCFGRSYAASGVCCPAVRRDVADALAGLGLSDEGVFAGSVVASELFTNAIVHHAARASELVHVGIQSSCGDGERWVAIAVTDAGRGAVRSAMDPASARADFGRGLELVRGMGARLTDVRVPGGYVVTAWIPVSDRLRRRVCRCDCPSRHGCEPSACSWLVEERDGWDEAHHDDGPGAHLCYACTGLLPDASDAAGTPAVAGR